MSAGGRLEIGGVAVEVLGFRGQDGHLFVLVDPAKRPRGPVNDGYFPWPDFGYVWIREDGGRWVATGNVSVGLVGDHGADIDRILDFISDDLLALDEQLATCVEVVEARSTHVFSGEEGILTFEGSRTGHRRRPASAS